MSASASQPSVHVAGFYQTDDFLAERVAYFVSEGLTVGEQVIRLATAAHWTAISARLSQSGLEFRRAVTEGRLLLGLDDSGDRSGLSRTQRLRHSRLRRNGGCALAGWSDRRGHSARNAMEPVGADAFICPSVRVFDGPFLQGRGPARCTPSAYTSRLRLRGTRHATPTTTRFSAVSDQLLPTTSSCDYSCSVSGSLLCRAADSLVR